MPKENTQYIPLDIDFFEDLKIKALRKAFGLAGCSFYLYIILKMRATKEAGLEYGEFTFNALSEDVYDTPEKVKDYIDACISPKIGLFIKDGDYFYSQRCRDEVRKLKESIEQKIEAGRKSWQVRRGLADSQPEEKPKRIRKPAISRLDDVLIPTPFESELREVLKAFKGWEYDEVDDLAWLMALTQDYKNVTVENLKACGDHHSENPRSKGPWKSRIRNWLRVENEKGNRVPAQSVKGNRPQDNTDKNKYLAGRYGHMVRQGKEVGDGE